MGDASSCRACGTISFSGEPLPVVSLAATTRRLRQRMASLAEAEDGVWRCDLKMPRALTNV